jgi:hypothetical protein
MNVAALTAWRVAIEAARQAPRQSRTRPAAAHAHVFRLPAHSASALLHLLLSSRERRVT